MPLLFNEMCDTLLSTVQGIIHIHKDIVNLYERKIVLTKTKK